MTSTCKLTTLFGFPPRSSTVYLEIDNRLCNENCFPSADSAAKYLGALSSMEKLRFPYPIKEVRGEWLTREGGCCGVMQQPGGKFST